MSHVSGSASRAAVILALLAVPSVAHAQTEGMRLDGREVFAARGAEFLAFHNWYSGLFSDSKLSGVELIHHGVRTATNGDVRLSNHPEQWDPVPEMVERIVDSTAGRITSRLRYAAFGFTYAIEVEARGGGVAISVVLDEPIPAALEGRAGFNLEFLPTAYFGRSWAMDEATGIFPRSPGGSMYTSDYGMVESRPIATGSRLVLAPEDPLRRVTVDGADASLALFDGRNQAQNGWFVVRSPLPAGRTGRVLEWTVTPNRVDGWKREPVISYSQVGYHPAQRKVAVLELDSASGPPASARVLKVRADGRIDEAYAGPVEAWGPWLRYAYSRFDFTSVSEPGTYVIEAAGRRTGPFRIAPDVFERGLWEQTLDTFLPVQMDHVLVNDRYRVWHGASHLDDARQAPVDHVHFDLYAQGPTTDTPYAPGEHIPGLNVGGWYDAGDYDIRTQSQYATVSTLAQVWETFGVDWDQTTVRREERFVDLRRPDGVPDILQQIEHGAIALLAQFDAVGHAIPGIIVPTIAQYTHLGDGLTMTDNLVHDPSMEPVESDGLRSGVPDDRWAFTSENSGLNLGSAAALAAASRALRGVNDSLAERCLQVAARAWEVERGREPVVFRHGNTTGGPADFEELRATVELLLATRGEAKYRDRLAERRDFLRERFAFLGALAVRAVPYMDEAFAEEVREAVAAAAPGIVAVGESNPFGVPVTRGGWGGVGAVLGYAMNAHVLHRAYPDLVGPEATLRGLDFVLGTHPASNVSLVSGVGAHSKTVAYGSNRADHSFIPGGVVPGIVIVNPDLPELQEDWPFLWFENEYVITPAATYIYVALAAAEIVRGM